jgi:cysteine protease ATG4
MLGKCYQPERSFVQEVEKALTESADFTILDNTVKRFPNLLTDFTNLFWFTYRKDFPRIEPSPYTSDAGWGCMMRSGQMLLAKAFACYLLGKGTYLIDIFY